MLEYILVNMFQNLFSFSFLGIYIIRFIECITLRQGIQRLGGQSSY